VRDSAVMVVMTRGEAQQCVERIRAGIDGVRADVLRLHEGEGWKTLGYESWRECVTAEFGQSQAYLYRLLDAARIEREIAPIPQDISSEATVSTIVETVAIPETVLRPLKPLLGDPDTMRRAWKETVDEYGPQPTAAEVAAKVAEIAPPKLTPGEQDRQEALARMAHAHRAREQAPQREITLGDLPPRPPPKEAEHVTRYWKAYAPLRDACDIEPEAWADEIDAINRTGETLSTLRDLQRWADRMIGALEGRSAQPLRAVK